MKVKANVQTKVKSNFKAMPTELQEKLHGLTLNEAVKLGHIDDLGNDDGDFIFDHEDENIASQYAIIQGCAVIVSGTLSDNLDEADLADCQFVKGISTTPGAGFGKPFFRLGMPQGIRLGGSVKKVTLEAAE